MTKRAIHTSAAMLLALAVLSGGPAAAQCLEPPADVNMDGITNISDMQCLILYAVHLAGDPLVPQAPSCLAVPDAVADINCDQDINISDLVLTASYAVELPLSPLVDGDASGCVDACEVPGSALVVPVSIVGSAAGPTYTLDSLGPGVRSPTTSTGGGFTLEPKAVGLLEGPGQ